MADVLAWIAAFFLTGTLFTVLMVVATVWSLRLMNRVDPRSRSRAPLRWLWSVGACARLHRRLRAAARNAKVARTLISDAVVADLVDYACALDDRLVAVARIPLLQRVEQLVWLNAEVLHVEHLAARLCGLPAGFAPIFQPRGLRDVADRVDALDAARRELAAVEAGAVGRYRPL
jgi:hypothetical protein